MSKRALKIASRRPMLLALIVMATITIGLVLSGWLTPAPGRAGYNDPDPTANGENCDNPTTTTSCASAAQLVLSNVVINPVISNGAPYDSIVCLGGTITAQLLWFSIPSSNSVQTCHTCNGATPANYCDAPIYSAGASPFNITNTWTRSGIGGTNGFGDTVSFRCTNATSGNVTFANLSAMMTTNPPACGVSVGWATNAINPRTFAFVEVSDLSAQNYTPVADYGTNKIYRVCVVPANSPGTNITVIAAPNPTMMDKFLPGGWQMTGGMITTNADPNDITNSLTRRLVNITTPGTNVVTCVSGLSKKAVTIIVQQGTLHLANAIVFVNNNDDNGDGIPDKDDPISDPGSCVTGESHLMPLTLNLQCVDPMQTVTLSVNQQQSGIGGIRVWPNATRGPGSPVLDNGNANTLSMNWPASQMPTNLWVEGVSSSASPRDVILTLQPGNGCSVTTNLTVCNIQLAVDNNHDGNITFDSADQTSASKPYRFWVNDDQDYLESNSTGNNGATGLSETSPVLIPDYTRGQIKTIRDLEDFTRLNILVQSITQEITSGALQIGLKWKNTGGTSPAIKLFRNLSPNGDMEYLTDAVFAQQFLFLVNPGYVAGAGTYLIPTAFWSGIDTTHNTGYSIFEGCSAGKGQLVVTINKPDGTEIAEAGSIWLDIKDIKSMYQRAAATPSSDQFAPPYNQGGSSFYVNGLFDESNLGYTIDNTIGFEKPADETPQCVVFVHGWRMSYDDYVNFSETMFKRLWWQGYKGRFCTFYWETLTSVFSFNTSEFRAWKYGLSLKKYVESQKTGLPGYSMNIVAHSMGNIVTGSALHRGLTVDNYVLMQAAVAAGCYDASSGINSYGLFASAEASKPTPDFAIPYMGYRGYLANVTGNLVNIFNVNDYALATGTFWAYPVNWEANQVDYKPDSFGGFLTQPVYYYNITKPVLQSGEIFFSIPHPGTSDIPDRYVNDPHEMMSFVARPRSKAVGALADVAGRITGQLNVGYGSVSNFGGEAWDHSGEFNRTIQQLGDYYRSLAQKLGVFPDN